MKAITIRQPYASLIMRGLKRAEYRNWRLPLGRLAIHAARVADDDERAIAAVIAATGGRATEDEARRWIGQQLRGMILGTAHVIGHERAPERELGTVANILGKTEEWEEPIRAIGQQAIWEFDVKKMKKVATLFG